MGESGIVLTSGLATVAILAPPPWFSQVSVMGSLSHTLKFLHFRKPSHGRYESLSDVGESRVWFASKNLTPCRMH